MNELWEKESLDSVLPLKNEINQLFNNTGDPNVENVLELHSILEEHERILRRKDDYHQILLRRILHFGVHPFLDVLRSNKYYPSQHIAHAISIMKEIPLIIWGKNNTEFQLNERFICGIAHTDDIPERCIHIFNNDSNHFMHLQHITTVAGPILPPGFQFTSLINNNHTPPLLRQPPRRSTRIQHEEVRNQPIPQSRPPIPSESIDDESSSDDDDLPHGIREWRHTVLDWRYGFARNSAFLSTVTGTNEQRDQALSNLLSEFPSDNAEETRIKRLKTDLIISSLVGAAE